MCCALQLGKKKHFGGWLHMSSKQEGLHSVLHFTLSRTQCKQDAIHRKPARVFGYLVLYICDYQAPVGHSCLSLLSHCRLILACGVELLCKNWSPLLKKKKSIGMEWTPQILRCDQKVTQDTYIFLWMVTDLWTHFRFKWCQTCLMPSCFQAVSYTHLTLPTRRTV